MEDKNNTGKRYIKGGVQPGVDRSQVPKPAPKPKSGKK
jgi:hypothetical protein